MMPGVNGVGCVKREGVCDAWGEWGGLCGQEKAWCDAWDEWGRLFEEGRHDMMPRIEGSK